MLAADDVGRRTDVDQRTGVRCSARMLGETAVVADAEAEGPVAELDRRTRPSRG